MKIWRKGKGMVLLLSVLLLTALFFIIVASRQSDEASSAPPISDPTFQAELASESVNDSEEVTVHASKVSASKTTLQDTGVEESAQKKELYLVYSQRPVLAYKHYIDDANNGDAEAQLRLALVLERCSVGDIRTIEQLEEVALKYQSMTDDYVDALSKRIGECGDLWSLLGEQQPKEVLAKWVKAAAAQGHPVATVKSLLTTITKEQSTQLMKVLQKNMAALQESNQLETIEQHQDKLEGLIKETLESVEYEKALDEARNEAKVEVLLALYDALSFSSDSKVLLHESYKSAHSYYSSFSSERWDNEQYETSMQTGDFRGPVASEAWYYLQCKTAPDVCDFDYDDPKYFSNDLILVQEKASEFETAIRDQNWAALGLE